MRNYRRTLTRWHMLCIWILLAILTKVSLQVCWPRVAHALQSSALDTRIAVGWLRLCNRFGQLALQYSTHKCSNQRLHNSTIVQHNLRQSVLRVESGKTGKKRDVNSQRSLGLGVIVRSRYTRDEDRPRFDELRAADVPTSHPQLVSLSMVHLGYSL